LRQRQPNILLVMADQLTALALPCYGHPVVRAPNLGRLADRGVVFENAYCNSPLCAPSRFSMMSGRLPSRVGAYDNACEFPASVPTLAHGLRALGYRTCLAGKMHFVGPDQLHGFEERVTTDIYPADFAWTPNWDQPEKRIDWWYHNMSSVKESGVAEATNQLDYDDEVGFFAQRQLRDLAREEDGKPFFLCVSFTHPHDPYVIRQDYWDRYERSAIDLPRVGALPAEALDAHSRRLQHVSAMSEVTITEEDVRRSRRAYYGAVSYVDDWVGTLVRTLKDLRLADDTIVVVAADHGDMLGERGLWYKMAFFEWALRIPLIVNAPARFGVRRVAAPVSLVDLLPTFLDLGQTDRVWDPGVALDGRTLVPLIEGGIEEREVRAEYLAEGALAPILMLRRDRWKYVWSEPDPPQLYDLETDPDELHNLAALPEHAETAAAFAAEIGRRWDAAALREAVLASQRSRRALWPALTAGHYTAWDFQPRRDVTRDYIRNNADLNDREYKRRYPRP
jgi:choline-sulfatase